MNSYTNDSFYENMSHQTEALRIRFTIPRRPWIMNRCYISIGIMKWSF